MMPLTCLLILTLVTSALGELKASFETPDKSWQTMGTMYAKNCKDTHGTALFFFAGGSLSSRPATLGKGPVHQYRALGARFNQDGGVSRAFTLIHDSPR